MENHETNLFSGIEGLIWPLSWNGDVGIIVADQTCTLSKQAFYNDYERHSFQNPYALKMQICVSVSFQEIGEPINNIIHSLFGRYAIRGLYLQLDHMND